MTKTTYLKPNSLHTSSDEIFIDVLAQTKGVEHVELRTDIGALEIRYNEDITEPSELIGAVGEAMGVRMKVVQG